jgi:MFS family permease
MREPGTRPGATLAARAALALYPPSWRARYGDEVHALLDESGGGLRAIASVAWRALPAWIWPPRHLHDGPARMRASLSTGLMAWSFLIGLGLVFAQLTQFQGYKPNAYPFIAWSYLVFDAALAISVLAAGLGGLPLWLLMLRRAHRERRRRDTVYLLLPLIVPAAYLAGLSVTISLVGGAQGVSQGWFLIVIGVGFAAAGLAASGPGLALRRLQPRGPALRLAAIAAGAAAAAIAVAVLAIIVAVTGLSMRARGFAGYHHAAVPGVYLTLVVAAAAVTAVSAARGARAALHA